MVTFGQLAIGHVFLLDGHDWMKAGEGYATDPNDKQGPVAFKPDEKVDLIGSGYWYVIDYHTQKDCQLYGPFINRPMATAFAKELKRKAIDSQFDPWPVVTQLQIPSS